MHHSTDQRQSRFTGYLLFLTGSGLVATHDLSLEAKNDIALQASDNSYASNSVKGDATL